MVDKPVIGQDPYGDDLNAALDQLESDRIDGDAELTASLVGKAAASHTHAQSDVTGLVAALSGKATASDLTAHVDDSVAAHAASAIEFNPAGGITATDVQAAIVEAAGAGSYSVGAYVDGYVQATPLPPSTATRAEVDGDHVGAGFTFVDDAIVCGFDGFINANAHFGAYGSVSANVTLMIVVDGTTYASAEAWGVEYFTGSLTALRVPVSEGSVVEFMANQNAVGAGAIDAGTSGRVVVERVG